MVGCKDFCSGNCSNIIIVDRNKIDDEWRRDNSSFICDENGDNISVDLAKVGPNNDYKKQAKWLKDNDDKFNYVASYSPIKNIHEITDPDILKELPQNGYKSVTFEEIKKRIKDEGGNFEQDNYDHYVRIIRFLGIKPVIINDFNPRYACFSIPFIKSIMAANQEAKALEFNTHKIEGKNVLFFRVGTHYSYFNYTHYPTFCFAVN